VTVQGADAGAAAPPSPAPGSDEARGPAHRVVLPRDVLPLPAALEELVWVGTQGTKVTILDGLAHLTALRVLCLQEDIAERTLTMLREHGWSPRRCVPHGGHQFALNIATGLGLGGNESYPEVFAPFGGFASGVPVENSRVAMPEIPGIGFEAKNDLWAVLKDL
jgi:hypothetical protein